MRLLACWFHVEFPRVCTHSRVHFTTPVMWVCFLKLAMTTLWSFLMKPYDVSLCFFCNLVHELGNPKRYHFIYWNDILADIQFWINVEIDTVEHWGPCVENVLSFLYLNELNSSNPHVHLFLNTWKLRGDRTNKKTIHSILEKSFWTTFSNLTPAGYEHLWISKWNPSGIQLASWYANLEHPFVSGYFFPPGGFFQAPKWWSNPVKATFLDGLWPAIHVVIIIASHYTIQYIFTVTAVLKGIIYIIYNIIIL